MEMDLDPFSHTGYSNHITQQKPSCNNVNTFYLNRMSINTHYSLSAAHFGLKFFSLQNGSMCQSRTIVKPTFYADRTHLQKRCA